MRITDLWCECHKTEQELVNIDQMARGSKSTAKKPPKKSKLLTFRTPKETRQLKLKQNSASLLTPSKHGTDAVSSTSVGKTANSKITISTLKKSQERKRDTERDNFSWSKKNSSEISMDGQYNENRKKTMNTIPSEASNGKADTMKERKRNTPEISQVKQKETKVKTQTKRKNRRSVNFIAPKDKRPNIRDQSMTGHTLTRGNNFNSSGRSFNISASSISQLSDTPDLVVSRSDSQASQPIKDSISSTVQPRTSQKRKIADDKVQTTPGGQAKKRKTSKKPSPNNTSVTTVATSTTRGKRKLKRSPGIPVALDRIRDLKVTKKSFEKWKPMSKVTTAFVENILKSVILNVSADGNLSKDEESERCLSMLRNKVMERLPNLKAPHTKGDYGKMESENKLSEDVYLEKTRELKALDKKIEEEQRLLETQLALVAECAMKRDEYEAKLEAVEKQKAHPLIEQTKDVLNLPKLSGDFCIEDEAPSEKSKEELKLCNTLLDLRRKTKEIGLDKWMDKLSAFTKKTIS